MCKKHEWKLIHQFTTESIFEQVIRLNFRPMDTHSLKKKYITDYTCINCGKLKRFKESN